MLSPNAQQLLASLAKKDQEERQNSLKPKVNLNTSMGPFAFIYEKIRNFIDYEEEHLLLRRAITRILVRRIKSNNDPKFLVNSLVTELLMARYLHNNSLTEDKLPQAQKVLERYLLLYRRIGQRKNKSKENFLDFLLSLAAREIEEIFAPSVEDQLLNFAVAEVEKRAIWLKEEEENKTRLLVALMRALAKYDERTTYFKLWKLYFPGWSNATEREISETAENFFRIDSAINWYLEDKDGELLVRILKKQIAPFEILRDLINRRDREVQEIFFTPEKLTKAAFAAANFRYHRAISSLRQSAVNSFIYIFITKMAFALALEIPYELYIAHKVNYLPIVVNFFLPPSLMLFMALSVELPTEENTQKIVNEISAMVFGGNLLPQIRFDYYREKSTFMRYVFDILYVLAFIIAFGGSILILRKLNFSIVSLAVFFFFLSTISFFAFRIRSSFKELVVGEEGPNLVSLLFDFFMLPFIYLGRLISSGFRDVNIFVFIFDIIIEAPFKMILEIIEEWIKFLREKKEEALNVIR